MARQEVKPTLKFGFQVYRQFVCEEGFQDFCAGPILIANYTLISPQFKSKETYGQTRGLSNLEIKHVGKLSIIGALLKAVKTSCVRTMQGRTYKIARVVELQLNMEW